jgi:hypothetical protein
MMNSFAVLDVSSHERIEFSWKEVVVVQTRVPRRDVPVYGPGSPIQDYQVHPLRVAGEGAHAVTHDIQDLLGSMTDRPDLERLFARNVGLDWILKLMGRQISREQILELIESPHLEEDLRKLLR